ncbi:MAG: family 16 glycosylhydrolase [Candidatus Eisenbacteria bacterium]|nr:family 16 glycosylhydrolase [Candidatus Eisenbacteria bacterium]
MTSRKTIASLGALALAILLVAGTVVPASGAMSLVWSDEFDGTGLDTGNWTIDIGDGCPDLCGWGNNELEYYRAQNVSVTGGYLTLTAKDEYYGGRHFTSGKVHTRDKQSFLYGRIEMRAKLPTGGGMWPAFWMMPQDSAYGGWAASGEIDIMESANSTTWIGGTIHFGGSWPENTYSGGTYAPGGVNFADDFHVYAIEWEPEEIRWYVDGVHYLTKYSSQWYSDNAPGNPLAPFDQPFYIILNAAVGGNYTGCTETGCISADLPQEYVIDYVRVYQETGNQAPEVAVMYPTEGDNPPAGDITITVTASDPDGSVARVEFYDGTTYLGQDETAPYTFTWTSVADGCYSIEARAFDDEGAFTTDTADITVGAGCGQAPYLGSPFTLPSRIEAEDYDVGGEGVAYHDTDAGNNGDDYRPGEDVDTETCSDVGGGYNVGWIMEGEWLEYTLDVPVPGEYDINIRVASQSQGGVFHLEFNGENRTGDIVVPVTGDWQSWTTVTSSVTLPAGPQLMRFVPTSEGFNVNWFDFGTETGVAEAISGIPRLRACYPNPFNPRTTIRYVLPEPTTVSVAIYSPAGRLVRELVRDRPVAAGRHEVVWNGRNESGRTVAAGVYSCRLKTPDGEESVKLTLLK